MVMEKRDLALVNKDDRYMYLLSVGRSCQLPETQLMVAMHNQELVHLLNKWQTEEQLIVLTFPFFHLKKISIYFSLKNTTHAHILCKIYVHTTYWLLNRYEVKDGMFDSTWHILSDAIATGHSSQRLTNKNM